jgi:hypothetical protein
MTDRWRKQRNERVALSDLTGLIGNRAHGTAGF